MLVHVHGAIFPEVFVFFVASSDRSEGWGHYSVVSELWLQHGPEWAMKGQIAEAGFLLPSSNQKIVTEKPQLQNFSKCWNHRPIRKRSEKFFRCGGALSGKAT